MKNIFSATVFLTLAGVIYIFGQGIPRYDSAYGLLSNKIYCFGGKITKDENLDNSINVLDIVAYSGSTADELKNKWQNISSNMNGHNIRFTSHFPECSSSGWKKHASIWRRRTRLWEKTNNSCGQQSDIIESSGKQQRHAHGLRQPHFFESKYVGRWHTTTIVGPEQRDVLLFGGACKTPKYDCPYEITDTILILDTTTPSQITLMENYIDANNVNVSSKKPSTVAIIGTIVLWYKKNKKFDEKKRQQEIEEHERQQRIDDPANEVDWDELDKIYAELPSSIDHKKSYSPLLANNAATGLIAIQFQRPDAIDENDIPVTSNYTVQKPDGGA
ncbi:hypothetical protein INT47_006146 [Mucor saturninus]|uniref:Uncharacterized protein n=1 Tax=Mucor saturninus TaxID=64648 RepID=A0A8H7RDE4_9FUNG|nr:hypothetical protein INT47_006146 [Mucor saturninus]